MLSYSSKFVDLKTFVYVCFTTKKGKHNFSEIIIIYRATQRYYVIRKYSIYRGVDPVV